MHSKYKIIAVIACYFLLSACRHEPIVGPLNTGNICNKDSVYFTNDVLPILISNCAMKECHDGTTAAEGVKLTTYNSIIQTGEIKKGNPYGSKLFEAIVESDPADRMPPAPHEPLDNNQVEIIRKWIEQGAENKTCIIPCDTTNVTYSQTLKPVFSTYCTGCHSGPTPSGNILLNNYDEVLKQVNSGKLYGSISHTIGFTPMPDGGAKLSNCKINQIKIWIAAGAPNN